ncbi:hypothetical protein tpqmel_0851, partial [Candidatus Gastranaerophilus sp. (ex Termes propinquus)]
MSVNGVNNGFLGLTLSNGTQTTVQVKALENNPLFDLGADYTTVTDLVVRNTAPTSVETAASKTAQATATALSNFESSLKSLEKALKKALESHEASEGEKETKRLQLQTEKEDLQNKLNAETAKIAKAAELQASIDNWHDQVSSNPDIPEDDAGLISLQSQLAELGPTKPMLVIQLQSQIDAKGKEIAKIEIKDFDYTKNESVQAAVGKYANNFMKLAEQYMSTGDTDGLQSILDNFYKTDFGISREDFETVVQEQLQAKQDAALGALVSANKNYNSQVDTIYKANNDSQAANERLATLEGELAQLNKNSAAYKAKEKEVIKQKQIVKNANTNLNKQVTKLTNLEKAHS